MELETLAGLVLAGLLLVFAVSCFIGGYTPDSGQIVGKKYREPRYELGAGYFLIVRAPDHKGATRDFQVEVDPFTYDRAVKGETWKREA